MPFAPTMRFAPHHMRSSVEELVFNRRDLDFSRASTSSGATTFDPSYGTLAVRRLSQHPFRGVYADLRLEPATSRPVILCTHVSGSQRGRPAFQIEEPSYPYASMPCHALVTGKINNMPAPNLAAFGGGRLYGLRAPVPSELALARAVLPDARHGPSGSRQPFGQAFGRNRSFVHDVRTRLP